MIRNVIRDGSWETGVAVAQLLEQVAGDWKVTGSNPGSPGWSCALCQSKLEKGTEPQIAVGTLCGGLCHQ